MMKTILLCFSVLLLFQGALVVKAQPNVFHRDAAPNNLWWHDVGGQQPWFREGDGWWIARPDLSVGHTLGRTFVHIGHNVHTTMVVNGATFNLKSLRLQASATAHRTFSELHGGTINVDTGIFNDSPGNHTFDVPIEAAGTGVHFDQSNATGTMRFNRSILMSHHTHVAVFRGLGNISVFGELWGAGRIEKEGTGRLFLESANTFTGSTTVRAGELILRNPAGNTLDLNSIVAVDGGLLRISSSQTLWRLTVGALGNVVIDGASAVTINDAITNTAGNGGLVLRSGTSLVHNSFNVPATMERFFAGTAQWRLVSSPVANQAISGPWTPATPNHGYDFYAWDEPAATWRNQKVGGNNITHFVPGRGYLVSFQAADVTQSFAGPLNNGDVSVTVVRGTQPNFAGANLLGNPYPSAIDWHLATRTLFADHFAYVYDPTAGVGGAYVPVNGAVAGAIIAPNQGFFVIKAAAGTGTFTFTNAMRVHGGTFRSAPANPTLSITLQKGEFYDRAQIVKQADATTLRERSDALKFFSLNNMMPQVYSLSADAMQLAVNSTPAFDQAAEFVIGILAPATGTYTLRVDGLEQILQGRPAFLLDRVTGASHNLVNQPQISFHAVQGGAVDRFVLSFTQPTRIGDQPLDAARIYYANGMLHLRFDSEDNSRSLQVIDLSGRIVLSKSLQNMGNVMSVPLQLDNGAYIVRITGHGTAVNHRLWVK